MRFIFNLTKRETRSSWRRLLFFFLCIALGVGSVVALRSLIQNLNAVVGNDARALMTADLEVSSTNDFAVADIAKVTETVARFPIVDATNETITTSAMARPADATKPGSRFVELKGVEPPFPLVGDFRLSDGTSFDNKLLENNGTVVARILLEQMDVAVGDKINIGEGTFEIRAVFDEEPGGSSGFRIGARVFVEKKAFDDAGITRNSSRVRRRILYRTVENPTELVKELRAALKGSSVQVNSYREQQENLDEQFVRTENYLSLTGLLILVLGGVGVWNVARAFVEQKRKTIAVLKCLGAAGNRVITVYLLQMIALGIVGSIVGIMIAQIGLWMAELRFADALPAAMSYRVNAGAALQGALLGILISVLFSILPLLQIRTIKPRLLLRDENNDRLSRLDWKKWIAAAVIVSALLGLAIWQSGSIQVGIFFLGGIAVTGVVLYAAAIVLLWILKRAKNIGSFSIRQSINSLHRPGNQTRIVILAVGLGAFVVIAVQLLQINLVREFDFSRNSRLPSLIFADIQKSQIDDVAQMIAEKTGEEPQQIPTVRARIAAVNGEAIDYQQREVRQRQGQIGREFAITYRAELEENETTVGAKWWPATPADVPEVSVEDRMATTLNLAIGDSITFDISGRKITARVANFRKIDIRNSRTVFVFVFRPGTLEAAPQTYGATVVRYIPATERQQLQRSLLDRFPNVQVFDIADIIASVNKLVTNFVIAISFIGSFVLLTGILILIGSVALTRSQRIYENAILKTLGASRRTILSILVGEYFALGAVAGIIATFFAGVLSYVVCRYLLNIEWEFDPLATVAGVVITTILVTAVGTFASFDLLFKKPLSTLRSQ
jgi:putative ABC transport system permease protein